MAFITEDSDTDSVATNTTAESSHDEDEGFNVESILAESSASGSTEYLVEWAGYPLHRCSWEGAEQFGSR